MSPEEIAELALLRRAREALVEDAELLADAEVLAAQIWTTPAEEGGHEEVEQTRVERTPQPEKLRRSTSEPSALNASARKMLEMLEQIAPACVPWGSLASMVGNKARGGNFNAARKAMRESGLIVEDGDTVRSSNPAAKGVTRAEALQLWQNVLSNPAPRMIQALCSERDGLTKVQIGERLGIVPRGGNFNNGVAQLIRNGVVTDTGGVLRLAEPLPGESK